MNGSASKKERSDMDMEIKKAAEFIRHSQCTLALTGAGISVESGIPDFRSAQGLWSRYNPEEYATIFAFQNNPEKVWQMLKEMDELVLHAQPNPAHVGLGEMEQLGFLQYIITQNIDNLHQAGGAKNVIEYHGNSSTLSCLSCGKHFKASEKRDSFPPRCTCRKILKPNVVFFGEAIPHEALTRSFQLAATAQVLLIIGTSALVSPANTLPEIAKQNGAKIIEINMENTHLTDSVTDLFVQGGAGSIVPALVQELKKGA
jgi:NAD-dependent deacetylase